MESSDRILVIGGGIVGMATAYQLLKANPSRKVVVLEKEAKPGLHQSTHNSGVLHAGLYYKPGSLKAQLAVSGIREMVAFCQEFGVPHEICGKLVIATDEAEVERLKALHERGRQNGLAGLEWLDQSAMREIEPHAGGIAALRVPQEGIVDYAAVIQAMRDQIERMGGEVVTNARVLKLHSTWTAETTAGTYAGNYLINCAGLHCDRVARLAGARPGTRIIPFRGEYYKLRPERASLVRHLIYPVPDPQFPFLGVHFTRLIHGGVEAGPNAVFAFAREGYRKTQINPGDLVDALSTPGLWKFLGRHLSMCWRETLRSHSKERFCKSLQKLVPEVQTSDLAPGGAGVRAQAISPTGDLVQDFDIVEGNRALHILNAPSPAATASLAIGSHIAAKVT